MVFPEKYSRLWTRFTTVSPWNHPTLEKTTRDWKNPILKKNILIHPWLFDRKHSFFFQRGGKMTRQENPHTLTNANWPRKLLIRKLVNGWIVNTESPLKLSIAALSVPQSRMDFISRYSAPPSRTSCPLSLFASPLSNHLLPYRKSSVTYILGVEALDSLLSYLKRCQL